MSTAIRPPYALPDLRLQPTVVMRQTVRDKVALTTSDPEEDVVGGVIVDTVGVVGAKQGTITLTSPEFGAGSTVAFVEVLSRANDGSVSSQVIIEAEGIQLNGTLEIATPSLVITTAGGIELTGDWIFLDGDPIEMNGVDITALPTAWTGYTPTLSQGVSTNIAKTVTRAAYKRVGKTLHVSFVLAPTAGGTAGSPVTMSLPSGMTAAFSSNAAIGAGLYYDQSANIVYAGTLGMLTTTTVNLYPGQGAVAGVGGWGQTPNLAVANLDTYSGTFTIELA